MPIRLPLLIAAMSMALLVPAAARAADYVPDEVIVRYEEGTGGGVAARWLPRQAQRRSGRSRGLRAAHDR